ncbi:MAG: Translation initiation factor IF-2 [Chlamydiales bacterium]|nr:Translation initiation factor IF-2 [Chlamydiales bacterium]MCH9620198.1 Translation initiation factor IF-2 [Chlamydiales bacterium]MCH9623087.1 Translation initiation factor IF-2 [Chlamydiales bacterium]
MTKNLKIKIKNTQLAKAAGLTKIKTKLSKDKKGVGNKKEKEKEKPVAPEVEEIEEPPRRIRAKSRSSFAPKEEEAKTTEAKPEKASTKKEKEEPPSLSEEVKEVKAKEKLGPTGRHVKDLLKAKPESVKKKATESKEGEKPKEKPADSKLKKGKKVKSFKDLNPAKNRPMRAFDARDRAGLSAGDDERWRKRRAVKHKTVSEENVIRPTSLKIRLPITVKDLASEMKLKSSQLIQKLFLQNMTFTLNDFLEDETMVQFLGNEFGCEITIDTSEEERLQVTGESIQEEIASADPSKLILRPPVVAFMGHVDHGKTSLIDKIRKSNVASGEAGDITQHIGAFKCATAVGELTILDTPGHEAFSAMRARGADVTDIVVLVVAGDEGIREQTQEAISHAKASGVTIVVAINKCDKPNFDADNIYQELSRVELLPEKWGGQTITVNTSAITGEGIVELLEMLALQAEVLELKADPSARARGTVLESELHKGLGAVATILVQNGTLNHGDALVFEKHYGRVKTMHDEHGKNLTKATPSTPIEMTGLSGLPAAGDPFIVVKSEKEAKNIIETREVGRRQLALTQRKIPTLETLLEEGGGEKKILNLILRGDVQGSVEALRTSLLKIESEKAEVNVIYMGVGEISESDIQLAAASNAVIIGFHTAIESHADPLIKEHKVVVKLHDIIYHAVDDVKAIMTGLLDKIEEEKEMGEAEVKAIFKSSHLGVIAGCQIDEGMISRNHKVRLIRDGEEIWRGSIASIKRDKEDVKEVKKGFECGIVLNNFSTVKVGDVLQAYEIIYLSQEL